ncbi:MAG: molybdenum cofactor biosynthesis protein MoaE [Gammaproteobacteria bacterium]
MLARISIQKQDFDIGAEWAQLRSMLKGRAGAMAAFCGVVRDQLQNHSIQRLELEHYPGMTEKSIEAVLARAQTRWPLDAVVVVHRIGALEPADQIVLVMCAAQHRQAALESCAFVIDLLKTEAVFWKREVSEAGARWVDSTTGDADRSAQWGGKL